MRALVKCTCRGKRRQSAAANMFGRFAALPVTDMLGKLEGQTKDIEGEVDKLGQRLLYLETTHKNSREHIEQMLRKG